MFKYFKRQTSDLSEDTNNTNERLLVGAPTVVPRIVDRPIRMPLPSARNQGSIYENQTALGQRYFATDRHLTED